MKQWIGGAAVAIIALLYLGFGFTTYTSLKPETPTLISDYGMIEGSSSVQHFATVRCVAEGAATALYVKDEAELKSGSGPIHLLGDAEVTTLARARRLMNDRPGQLDYDPGCRRSGYFEPRKSTLLQSMLE